MSRFPDAVEQQVHRAKARDAVDQLDSVERAALERLLLDAVESRQSRQVGNLYHGSQAGSAS
jgi:hypothetical protein